MGIRGLSLFLSDRSDVYDKHKLRNCNVIIDGKNLAHLLHKQCSGINVAFGGDFDKYSSFVKKFFEGLRSCGVNAFVVMDGGQPLNGKKFKTARERAKSQIERSLAVCPENQFLEKIMPPMCLQVFVTTLHNMGVLVRQTDYEADDEIAALARELNCYVISDDTDFYVTNVSFIPLSSVEYKNITKKSIPCLLFNIDKFCQVFNLNRSHLALLGTLMANDYVDKQDLAAFHKKIATQTASYHNKSMKNSRIGVIKGVIKWISWQRKKSVQQIIFEVTGRNSRLQKKIQQSIDGYTMKNSGLLNCIPYVVHTEEKSGKVDKVPKNTFENIEYTFHTGKQGVCQELSEFGTSLKLKNGEKPPYWFITALRESKIPHEVVDILTQGYFFSPTQVECVYLDSSYLVVEPVVRSVFTFLWKGCNTNLKDSKQSSISGELMETSQEASLETPHGDEDEEEAEKCANDSDVVVEDEEEVEKCTDSFDGVEEDGDSEGEDSTRLKSMEDLSIEDNKSAAECDEGNNMESNDDSQSGNVTMEDDSLTNCQECHETCNRSGKCVKHEAGSIQKVNKKRKLEDDDSVHVSKKNGNTKIIVKETVSSKASKSKLKSPEEDRFLLWYIRKKNSVWCKRLGFLKSKLARKLPSLSQVGNMTVIEKKSVFYKMLNMESEFKGQDIPPDLELILNFIIYWFRNSKLDLYDCHALTVLLCIFMYYLIDCKTGRVRTRKEFENVKSCQEKLSEIMKDPSYCKPDADVKDLLVTMSKEECLVAANNMFQYHHIDKTMHQKKYRRGVVHAFSEYQACVYFLQLLNSLLSSPFPLLSIEFLWGGTFSYNIFICLSGANDRIAKATQFLGKGTCLEKLFCKLYSKLEGVVKFCKPPVNKKDKFNNKKFQKNDNVNSRSKCSEVEVPEKTEEISKEKMEKKLSELPGNRFALLTMDSDSE